MFWKFDLNTTSHIEKLLDKEDVTLRELMDEDDILQECKAQNQRLLDFLCQQHCMEELVNLITHEPPTDMEERMRFKYANTACELLTSDVPQINDKLGGDQTLLNILYDFLVKEPPLNPLLASFFSKTIGNLIARKAEQVIEFLKSKEGFISLVLRHIDTSAMMDLQLRLVSCVEPAPLRQEVLNWLNKEKLIQRLIDLIRPNQDEDRQSNASQTLCDIIRLSRDQASQLQENPEPDPLLTVLESQEIVEQLLKNMFDGEKNENCIVNGTQILLTLLEPRRPGVEGLMDMCAQGYERSYTVNSSILCAIEPRLKDFHQLLLQPPKKSAILTTIGVLEEPLGNARLHVCRLIAALLQTNTASINQELCRLSTLDLLLDLFFKYTWNNFLHLQVELCVAAVLSLSVHEEKAAADEPESKEEVESGNPNPNPEPESPSNSSVNVMVTHLFQKCCLVQRILDAWEDNDKIQGEGGMRRGNMGHLTRIANGVVQNMEKGPIQTQISNLIKELPEDCRGRWESFVGETLTETNRRNTIDLVSTYPLHSSSEDEDIEGAFPNELSLQQAFSEYQIQQMTANFVDQFGFNEEEFAEQDDINAPFERIAEINFSIDTDDDSPNAALFEGCYNERIQQFDDDEDEDIWEEKEINYAAQVKSRSRFGVSRTSEGSSKSDVENGDQDGSVDSEEEGVEEGADGSGKRKANSVSSSEPSELKRTDSAEGPGWTAAFDEPVNSKPPASCVAMDVGSSVWHTAAPEDTVAEEKGWAKFTDFQPFCCSESGPRCSSPVDTDSNDSEGNPKHNQDKNFSTASPCVWNVCVARKAPLVASDSSSSGGSDSEEEEDKADIVTETITTGSGHETIKLTMDAKNEKAVFTRIFRPAYRGDGQCMVIEKLTISEVPQRVSDPLNSVTETCAEPQRLAAAETTTEENLCKDRSKEEVAISPEASLNGPA
ncbi:serine/threonine-protein phosphatase 6 regulatory subunit 2a isoform X2 [Latimeria chalumnae]|uniref:serine/threonine-protein phosphatase 6 regulatory subunit 2a isoform X2 n=1 Tax=Latimeria chalumnae TaxID=7897 RepID=UPI0006D8F5DE|nr:PREDICTED: serine/threonine-protein phosphatase 6 regulatory subunit 2 isoform X2 [Latimeria chalumnae]|eukprot:XP_014348808.1 PREDICTED: serine/threonine-protein phosphatase 6 regulatory subunit 2 isoform X2 [Latimeria chalumnae]